MSKPLIFISSTGDLRTARDLVGKALASMGYTPIWQDIEATHSGELLQVLRDRIKPCSQVIQLVGHRYGAEPPKPPDAMSRCSYTQFEALYAETIGKKVTYLWLPEDFPTDSTVPESEEIAELQRVYRQKLVQQNVLRHEADTLTALENRVLRLRDELAELRETGQRRHRRLFWVSAASLAVTLGVLAVLMSQWRSVKQMSVRQVNENATWLESALAETSIDPASITASDFAVSITPFPFGGHTQARVEVRPSDRVLPLVDGLEVRTGTGNWKRVDDSISPGNYFVLLAPPDLKPGKSLQLRLDSDYGSDVGYVIGPFTYDLNPGQILRDIQRANITTNNTWLVRRSRRWIVNRDFFQANADAISVVFIGSNPTNLAFRKELPRKPASDALLRETEPYTAAVRAFGSLLGNELGPFNQYDKLYAQFELVDGTTIPILEFPTTRTSSDLEANPDKVPKLKKP